MKKEDLLNDDFLKQFKSGEELNDFLKQCHIEHCLIPIGLLFRKSFSKTLFRVVAIL
ncbi:hypothetical protein [Sunxiuqinia indica]|uniref:hypothetical protein n=1 Tax=Sunxiuqinia indica TaxID=2692584 RepID=UPI0013577C53|nr:hypothetical protein [Sunxiuqinia indica]